MLINHETLLTDYDALRLAEAAEMALLGSRSGTVDPLARLLDPEYRDMLWEYDDSYIEPWVPGNLHTAQREALDSEHRHRLLFWGNQAGKTTVGAIDCVLLALGRHPVQTWQPPVKQWASALTWDLWEQILLPELLTWLPQDRIIDAPPAGQKSLRRTIRVRADNGTVSTITGKSAEQGAAKYQSARVHQVWLDEEHPESIWDELQPRLVRFGGRTLTTATPLLGLTWLYHRLYVPWKQGTMSDVWVSHAGMAANPANSEEALEAVRRQYAGDPAQAKARLHGHFAQPSGLALSFYDPGRNLESFGRAAVEAANAQSWTHLAGIDWGYWRFAFVHGLVDRANRLHVVREAFSQKQSLGVRAKLVHDHLSAYGAPPDTRIWSDSANPTDINEFNRELKALGSPYRCRGVRAEAKARPASVELLNNLFQRGALLIRRDLDDGAIWYRGQSAASDGHATAGSRLLYEIGQWRYPSPKSDEAQRQDPDDDTADGADCIAALRYLAMSHYRPPKTEKRERPRQRNRDYGLEELARQTRELAIRNGLVGAT